MKNIFSQISANKPGSNTFDLSHERKMSSDLGNLTPILNLEVVPGDVITLSTSMLTRMAPMVAPLMHRVNVYTHFFYVPNRILWDNWENFITGGEDGTDSSVFPYVVLQNVAAGDLGDYLGLPIVSAGTTGAQDVSCLPFAAYTKIYNEYYRDQNLIPKLDFTLTDGDNTANPVDFTSLRKRAWQHDYFTSGLPWTQKGPEATIPLGTTAPINWEVEALQGGDYVRNPATGALTGGPAGLVADTNEKLALITDGSVKSIDNSHHLFTDLSSATASSIIDLRRAFKLQEWLEKNARGGSRYIESILSHFGVRSSDARLQRPEFLGGGSTPIQISEVLQTSATATEPTPQGNMSGHGIAAGQNNSFKYRCEEHGIILGIMSIMPKTSYQQGIPKLWNKYDKFDYFWPSFAHIGEQPILNKEIYIDDDGDDDEVFAYTPRYAEYKYIPSTVHGEFKTTLDFWHWGRIFATRPLLNQDFVECNPDTRIFAVETGEKIYSYIHHNIKARRPMPYFGTPRL